MECPHCGLINPDTALRCECGYEFATGRMKGSYLRPMGAKAAPPIMKKKKRPGIVTAISCFYWLHALIGGAIGVIFTLAIAGPNLGGSRPPDQLPIDMPTALVMIDLLVVVVALVLAASFAAMGWGLWQLYRGARRAAIIVSGLVVIFNLAIFAEALFRGVFTIPYGIIFHGLALGALFRKDVKSAFEPTITP